MYRFFLTGWRPLVLWLLACFLIILLFAQVTAPAADTASANDTVQEEVSGLVEEANATQNMIALATANATENMTAPATANATQNMIALATANATENMTAPATANATQNMTAPATANTTENMTAPATADIIVPEAIRRSTFNSLIGNVTGAASEGVRSVASRMTTETAAAVTVLFIFGIFAYYGYRSRKQIVIGEIKNTVTDETSGKFCSELGSLLNGELHRLQMLYSEVNDRRAIASVGGRSGQLEYAIKAGEDKGKAFEEIIDQKTVIKIGMVEIPIGAVAGIFNKVFSGPRIAGTLHRDGDLFILNVFMAGKPGRSWRVEGSTAKRTVLRVDMGVQALPISAEGRGIQLVEDDQKKRIENFDAMVKELACRIFTDLTEGGTTRWRATYFFTEGLKDYRSCLLSKKDQLRNLKNAERRFLEAISEDSTFSLAWYNLGVVYSELENLEAAEQAFLKAIEMDPEPWEYYYALSYNRFQKMLGNKKYLKLDEESYRSLDELVLQDIIHPCKQAIALRFQYPLLHILIGVCYRTLAMKYRTLERECRDPDESKINRERSHSFFNLAFDHHRIAVRDSWYGFCGSQFRRTDDLFTRASDIRNVSSTALWDLARTCFSQSECGMTPSLVKKESTSTANRQYLPLEWLLRQSRSIDKTNANLHSTLGVVYYAENQFHDAMDSFGVATQIDPENLKYWLFLALSSKQAGDVKKMETAIGKILSCPSCMEEQLSPRWRNELLRTLPDTGKSRILINILNFQRDVIREKYPSPCEEQIEYMARLDRVKNDLLSTSPEELDRDTVWEAAYNLYHIGDMFGKPEEKVPCYQKAREFISHRLNADPEAFTWIYAMISNRLAKASGRSDDYQAAYNFLIGHHPRELKERKIEIDLVNSLLDEKTRNQTGYKRAFETASKILHNNPLGFGENYSWGRCLLDSRDYKQALFFFEAALLLEPFSVQTLMSIAECYYNLGHYCHNREEKDNFWRQSIAYYESAREAIKVEELRNPKGDDWDLLHLRVSSNLGLCQSGISEYGKALSNFEMAMVQSGRNSSDSKETDWDSYYCALNCAESLLHKRDHCLSEDYFRYIFSEFDRLIKESPPSVGSEKDSELEVMLKSASGRLGQISYAGELYIRALLGKAYSYAERDAGLEEASKHVEEAARILHMMREHLHQKELLDRKEADSGMVRSDEEEAQRIHSFLDQQVPLLDAEIMDKRGWIAFKNYQNPKNLQDAKNFIQQAIALKPDPEYYYHLATVCTALARETDEKGINIRMAFAHCDHALDMAPRKNLEDEVNDLNKKVIGYMTKLEEGFVDTLKEAAQQPKKEPK